MGVTIGMLGAVRAQYHLRQVFVYLDMHPLNRPEVMVPYAKEKFDAQGSLVDEKTRKKIEELLRALVAWTVRLKKIPVAQA